MTRDEFIRKLLPGALEASKRTGVDPRLIIAQAAQETGWGRSAPGNNYFGIKSHGKGGGQTFATHEVINGKRVKINDSFRKFDSPTDSALGYAEFLKQNPRYRPMMSAQGLDAQLQELGRSGYATDPNYSRSVGAIARNLNLEGVKPYVPGAGAQQRPAPPQMAGTPAPALPPPVDVRDRPIGQPSQAALAGLMAQPPAPAQRQQGMSPMMQQAFGAMAMQAQPQELPPPPPIHGPSPQQANGLLEFVQLLRNRARA